jgi:outer membrane receptor protein involved in Fe transport
VKRGPQKHCRQRPASGAGAWSALLAAITFGLFVAGPGVVHADTFRNLPLEQALQRLEQRGLTILYSSDLVQPWMRVQEEPLATDNRAILVEILKPFGVDVADGPNGSLLLVRGAKPPATPLPAVAGQRPPVPPPAQHLEEVVVSASHYQFVREPAPSLVSFTAADLQLLPDLGDDPLRAAARLPGTASSDFSSKVNVRGGETDETLVRFDDLRLLNPFHLKDFQSTFSTIDPGIISDVNIYAGGFPAAFGDRMSSVIDIEPVPHGESAYREVSLSFFNASVLAAGEFNDGEADWLVSARRGNLDLLIDIVNPDIGKPAYVDLHGRIRQRLSESLALSANALVFDDAIDLSDSDQEEQARAEYRDEYYWLRLDYEASAALSGNLLIARSEFKSARRGSADQEGIASGALDDRREFTINSLQSEWAWRMAENVLLQLGGEWRGMEGAYDYSDQAEFDVLFLTPGASLEPSRTRQLSADPDGDQFGAYANLRLSSAWNLTVDMGVRWDKETLSEEKNDQVSPRLSVLYSIGERTQLRASWGRFFQAQAISELQISDGVIEFLAPQRSNHLVASVEYRHPRGVDLRLEAYRKDYRQVRPRFENLLNTFVLLPELKPDRIRVAPETAVAEGAELTLRRAGQPPLGWWLSYSWSSVTDEYAGTEAARSWDQKHSVSAGITWQNVAWDLSLAGTYHTGWPTTEIELIATDPIPLLAAGPRNTRNLESYYALDVRVARKFRFENAGLLTVFLEVANVLNRTNDCCVEYEVEDESGELALDVSTRPYLPLTPSLGFVWRF